MRAQPSWRRRHRGSETRIARACAASIPARSGGALTCTLCLALLALAGPARAAPQPQAAPAVSSSSPSPDAAPGAASPTPASPSGNAASSSSSSVSTPPPASTSSPVAKTAAPAEQPAAPAVPQASGVGLGLAGPSVARAPSSQQHPTTTTPGNRVPVRSVPVVRSAKIAHHRGSGQKARHLPHRTDLSAAAVTRFSEPWRHFLTASSPVAALRSLLPLPRRSGLLLLFGAIALFVLAGASASLMRMLVRAGGGSGG